MKSEASVRRARLVAWGALVVGVLGALIAIIVILARVPAEDSAVRLIPAIISGISLVLSAVVFLANRSPAAAPENAPLSVSAAGSGSVAAGLNAIGNAVGENSIASDRRRSIPRPKETPQRAVNVTASGKGAVAAGGDVSGNALGKDSTVL